jgi:elongation factor Ts|tara:strand:+ start:1682 stop:2509 length:828 start_codon:yes stop_codon:yes gene_type:complete
MTNISASDVGKLRKQTGSGMMDCKNALVESNGDFDIAVDILRKKGQKVAAKRADRQAMEGVVIARNNTSNNKAVLISLNCETDFVAKNEDFINIANHILDKAISSDMSLSDDINDLILDNGMTVAEKIIEQTGVIGEKIEISAHVVEDVQVSSYVHAGNRLATLVGFNNKADDQVTRDIAMQIAAMNPLSIDKDGIDQLTIDRELEIAKDLARQEGKPEAMLDKIAIGRLNKFYKENTLLNQGFIKEGKKTVAQYLKEHNMALSVTCFKRVGLGN